MLNKNSCLPCLAAYNIVETTHSFPFSVKNVHRKRKIEIGCTVIMFSLLFLLLQKKEVNKLIPIQQTK